MPRDTPLHPEDRALYGASLRPPPGTVFDGGIATTYSLEFDTALAIPVTLALFAVRNRDELTRSPLALLEGLERYAEKLAIFAEAGRIQARPRVESRLCTLLEHIVVEVTAPNGGAFHPKLWVLRYRSLGAGQPDRIRLLVLSRNLTRDRSWDLSLLLDGDVTDRSVDVNRPLVDFVRMLPEFATYSAPSHLARLVESVAQSLDRAQWTLPPPFHSVSFAVNGIDKGNWFPGSCDRLGIVSPFCDAHALTELAKLPTREPAQLVSRTEELAAIPKSILAKFDKVMVMEELADSEGDEETDEETEFRTNVESPSSGLHAKAFLWEWEWDASITVGSGNATSPALISGRNVEVFATLTRRWSIYGRIKEMLGPESFGKLLRPYTPNEVSPTSSEYVTAERIVDQARRELARARLTLHCEPGEVGHGKSVWQLILVSNQEVPLVGIGNATAWPITLGNPHQTDILEGLRSGVPVPVARLALADLTKFFAFRIEDESGKAKAMFTLGLQFKGEPENRFDAVVQSVIRNRTAFLRYLRLLLADLQDPFSMWLAASCATRNDDSITQSDGEAVLEDMVRALSRDPDRLKAVGRLVRRLQQAPPEFGESAIPDEFLRLWESFRTVLDERIQQDCV